MVDESQQNVVQLSEVELAYVAFGAGRPVLLLHGFPLDHTMWAAQIESLAKQYLVVAPDLRGFGDSSLRAGDATRGVSMERYADDVHELLKALDIREKVVVVGFSMGGYIAWQFIRKYAQQVAAIVQCDTKATADGDEARAARINMAENVDAWGSAKVAEIMEPKLFAPRSLERRTDAVESVRKVISGSDTAAIAAAQRGMASRRDVTSMLPSIVAPTLVVAGEEDAIIPPAEMRKMADAIPNGQYVEIPRAGHMSPMENPEAVNRSLAEFLAGL